MKKCLYLFLIFLALFVFNACNNSSHVETAEYNRLVFDTAANNTKIPFPNDLIWQSSNGIVDLTANATDPSSTALYTAIKALNIKGLSPNTPLAIPLFSDKKLDENSFKESIFIFNLDNQSIFFNLDNQSIFSDFEAKQNENVINVYPLKPFDAGSRYAVIITDELKDVDGYPVMPAVIYKTIRDTDNCSLLSSDLANLCNAYNSLWNLGMAVNKLKDEILEVFTFTTADKTLSLNDFGVISATVEDPQLIEGYGNLIKGYSYSDLQSDNSSNEFLSVDALTDLPLLCASITDNITDNSTYFKSINLFNLGNIQGILKSYDFPDNQSNYSSVCSAIFDNSSLYTNVTMKRKDTASPDAFLIFQHGLGGSTDALDILADDFDNYILIGLDLPWHGGRVLSDNNPNTSCYENISGSCYLTDNPIYDRLNIYQSVFDMHILTKMVSLNALKLNKPVYFLGQSMGSITGSMLLNVDNVSKSNVLLKATSGQKGNNVVSKAVLNVGGGGYAALLNEATNALIKNLVAALNLEKHSIEYYITLGVFQLLLDPVDPAYFADNFAVTNKVILQAANGDTVVPNITNKILANAYNFDSSVYITPETDKTSDMISNPVPGFYVYGKDDNFVNHGFLLSTLISGYPEAEDYLDEDYVENMQGLAITQIKNFFSN